ncbi:hypothetical protein [Synechococcus sp. KORDI-100]|nr:hypothetical protein [Synechococcus sp. KORDI-100]
MAADRRRNQCRDKVEDQLLTNARWRGHDINGSNLTAGGGGTAGLSHSKR